MAATTPLVCSQCGGHDFEKIDASRLRCRYCGTEAAVVSSPAQWACLRCGAENPIGTRFCARCGESLARQCPSCNAVAYAGADFCSNCGKSLQEAPAAAAVPVSVPAPARPGYTSSWAIASLVLAFLMAGPLAAICGHLALREIKRSGGWIRGQGLAVAGLVWGYLQCGLFLVAIVSTLLEAWAWK